MKHRLNQTKLLTMLLTIILIGSVGAVDLKTVADTDETSRYVRFIHAAPYAGVVDVWNEKGIITTNFDYGLVSPYLKSADGENEVIYLAINKTDEIIAEFPIGKLKGGTDYTIIVHNVKDADTGKYDVSAIIAEDPTLDTETAGTFIAAAHTAADVGTVNVTTDKGLGDSWIRLAQGGYTGFVDLPTPNRILIDVNADRMADVTFTLPKLPSDEFVYGMVVSDESGVYLFALLSDNTLAKILPDSIEPEPMMSYVRIIHLSQLVGEVDVILNEQSKAADGLDYSQSIGYLEVQSGEYAVNLVKAGDPIKDTFYKTILSLDPMKSYTVVAYDVGNTIELQVTEDIRTSDKVSLNANIRASHLIDFVGYVDVYAFINTNADKNPDLALLINDLVFQKPQGYLEVPAAQYRIGLDIDQDGSVDLTYDLPQLIYGDIVDLYAALDPDGLPVIYTVVESGDIFVSKALEFAMPVDAFDRYEKSSKSDLITFQGKPDVIIDPPGGGFQPIEIMK